MKKKLAIVLVSLMGIGLFALPQTMALFAGQHSFYNIDPTGNQVPCEKCHGDVQTELSGAIDPSTGTPPPHANMKCEFCHRLQIGRSAGDNAYALITYANNTVINNNGTMVVTSGTIKRYAVIYTGDYEAGQYPEFINNTDTFTYGGSGNRTLQLNGATFTDPRGSMWNPSSISMSVATSTNPAGVRLNSDGTDLCGGQLADPNNVSAGFVNQTLCKGAGGKIYPLVVNGVPLDNQSSTQFTAFSPKLVNWSGATPIFDYAGSRAVNKGSTYHAASLIACMDCHGGQSPSYAGHETARLSMECQDCHYGGDVATSTLGSNKMTNLEAGGFGMGLTNAKTDTGSLEVHKTMVKANDSISVYGGRYAPASNDACIACHTHVDVQIAFQRPTTLIYAASEGSGADTGNWTTGGYTTGGSTTTYSGIGP